MAETLRGGLSLAASGFGFWSHDIGGFEGRPDPAVFKRWIPFGLLCSHSRLHGNQTYRVPWLFDSEAVDVLRSFTRLKHALMPYLFDAAGQAHRYGLPVLRPMVFGFPGDPAVTHLDRQYLLGDNLLVAPVFSEAGDTSYYVPAGRWTRFLTGEVVEGPGWVHETHGFATVPLLVRPDSVLAIGERTDRPDYDYRDGITLRLYELAEGARTTTVPGPAGEPATTFEVTRSGGTVRVVRTGVAAPWRVRAGDTVAEVAADEATCELRLR
jgi:alpha-D-xyloside xylohydrolase